MNHDTANFDVNSIDLDTAAEAANDQEELDTSHLLAVPRFFYLDHIERFGAKRAPELLGLVGHKAYLSVRDRHLASFAEDAAYYAAQPNGVDLALAYQARRTLDLFNHAKRPRAA